MKARKRRGIVLLLVLVVVAMLALASITFSDLMLSEHRAADTAGRQARARTAAQSGAEFARQFLDRKYDSQIEAGGIYDNSQRFGNVVVADDLTPQQRGYFSIVAPKIENNTITGVRYGLQDESMRINLNTLLEMDKKSPGSAKKILMALPSMTDEIADAILDWLDADDNSRDNGAEVDYYSSLTPPYAARNGSLQSIEELLLVRGVTPQLLFGLDAVPMGLIEAAPEMALDGVDNSDGSMDHGWAAYFTLYSAESTLKADGTAKIDLNGSDLKKLYDDLKEVLDEPKAKFIAAYRVKGTKAPDHPTAPSADNDENAGDTTAEIDWSKQKAATTINSILDLIGATAEIAPAKPTPGKKAPTLKSPFTESSLSSDLPKLMEVATVHTEETIKGRININQAPRRVLLCIPEVTADIADQIISKRIEDPKYDSEDHRCEMWPLCEGVVPLKTMRKLEPFITAGGSVYRAQIVAGFESGGTTARLEVILDASKTPTKLVSWKDMSRLPMGFPVEAAAARATATNNP
jgi:type II secretory pathway component PulK